MLKLGSFKDWIYLVIGLGKNRSFRNNKKNLEANLYTAVGVVIPQCTL